MTILLTCGCGHCQAVATALAGRHVRCERCGGTIAVPAMGLPVSAGRRKAVATASSEPVLATRPQPASRRRWALAMVGLIVMVVGVVGIISWAIHAPQEAILTTSPAPVNVERPSAVVRESTPTREKATPTPSRRSAEEVLPPPQRVEAKSPIAEAAPPTPREPAPIPPREIVKASKVVPPHPPEDPREGSFLQELQVTQRPTFRVQGIVADSHLQYQVTSRFTVRKSEADGSRIYTQQVTQARLVQADDTTRPLLTGAVSQLPGTMFTIHVAPSGEVVKFEGAPSASQLGSFEALLGGAGLRLTSLLDRDGWKEMAQATFFRPRTALRPGQRWSRPMTHGWGPLGRWEGQVHYTVLGPVGAVHKVGYALDLAYKSPATAASILSLPITNPKFQVRQAVGEIHFDSAKDRVVAAEERFRVVGTLQISVLGQVTLVQIDEDQHFALRIR